MYYSFFCGLLITYCTAILYKPPKTPYVHILPIPIEKDKQPPTQPVPG